MKEKAAGRGEGGRGGGKSSIKFMKLGEGGFIENGAQ